MSNMREEKVTIPDGSNAVAVDLADHSFVSILRNGREVVTDRGGGGSHRFILAPGDYVVRTDGNLAQANATKVELKRSSLGDFLRDGGIACTLRVSAAAPRVHPVDQVGQLPADGKTACTITIQQLDTQGKVMTDAKDMLYLRTTGGSLLSNAGKPTSRVQLEAGVASFQLVAEAAPRFVTVTVFGANPMLRAELPFEFLPPSELPGDGRPDR